MPYPLRRMPWSRARSAARLSVRARFDVLERLESRTLLSAAADITQLTALRNDPAFAGVDGSGVGVAVLDSGMFGAHPDLVNNFVGFFDAVRQTADLPASTDPAAAFDPNGHGTHTSGTIGSTNPEIGVATAADLVGVRALPSPGDPTPQFDTVANALEWVVEHHQQFNIRVVNMSLGVPGLNLNDVAGGTRPAVYEELDRLGITTVISSGNDYASFAAAGASSPAVFGTLNVANTWPDNGPSIDFPEVSGGGVRSEFFAVETQGVPDRLAATSQRSSLPNQVAAPGSGIFSTWNDPNKLYNTLSGTSMAAPFVSGVVALMQDAAQTFGGRYLTTDEVQSIVLNSADTIQDADNPTNGRVPVGVDEQGRLVQTGPEQDLPETGMALRRVNAYRAVQQVRALVQGNTNPPPPPAPDPNDQGDTNNTIASAVQVPALNATEQFSLGGVIGTDGTFPTGPDDVDLFQVVLEAPGSLSVATAPVAGGTNFAAALRLFADDGTFLDGVAGTAEAPYPAIQTGRLPAGTYYFGLSGAGNVGYDVTNGSGQVNSAGGGNYTVLVGLSNPDPNGVAQGAVDVDLTSPNQINPNTGAPSNAFSGSVGSDPNPLNPGGPRVDVGATDVDMFRLIAPDDGLLTIDVDAFDVDPDAGVDSYVRVFDANLQQIAVNDDEDPGSLLDSFLDVPVAAGGVYYVAVTTFENRGFNPLNPFDRVSTDPDAVGDYSVYLTFDNGDINGTVFDAIPNAAGEAIQGQIGFDQGQPVGGNSGGVRDVDFFQFDAPAGGLLDVAAASPDNTLLPVLTLWQYDAAQNDVVKVLDTAGADAHIIAPMEAGDTLFVSVTGLGNNDFNWAAHASGSGGDIGNYVLASALRPASDFAALTDNAVGAAPTAVAAGQSVYRSIGEDGGVTVGAADVDVYTFTPPTSGTFEIRALVPGEETTDPVLRIFDSRGVELASNDDVAAGTRDAAASFAANAGQTYYIGVNGSSAAAGVYDPFSGAGAAPGDGGDYVLQVSNAIVTFGGRQRAVYTDATGDVVIVSLKGPGSGTVRFPEGTSGNVDALGITLDGTTAASSLVIKVGGGGTPTGDVVINGALKALTAKTADLTGDLTAAGSVSKLAMRSAGGGHSLTFGDGAPATLTFGSVSDLRVTSSALIKAVKTGQWLDTDATPDLINSPLISSLTVLGEFGADVITGSLLKAKLGALNGSDVRADSVIGTLTAGSAADSRIFAGVAPTVTALPASAADFANPEASIRAVTVKGSFGNTLVGAPFVSKAALGAVTTTANAGRAFGLAADLVGTVKATTPSGPVKLARLDDPASSIVQDDFTVRVL